MRITTPYSHADRPRRPEVGDGRLMKISRRSGVGGPLVRLGRVWLASALVLSVLFGLVPGLASASSDRVGHRMTLAQAPAGLQSAVRSTLGASAATSGNWFQETKLNASDAAAGDGAGVSVAIAGSTALVGAYGKDGGAGAAYVYVLSGGVWSQQAELTDSDAATGDHFGISVALSGSTAVIGAYGKNSNAGAAYVFVHSSTGWSQQAELTASDAAAKDEFGLSVALYGSTTLIGAPGKRSSAGAAYVFVSSGTAWSQQAKLTAGLDSTSGNQFGNAVALYGQRAVVGAPHTNGIGAAYVFVDTTTGWHRQAKLTASDAAGGALFGNSVATYGSTAVIGAPDSTGDSAGAAYVFAHSSTGWSQQTKLTASDAAAGEWFGYSVALYGSTAVVGAPFRNGNLGAAYTFVDSSGSWSQQAELTASDAASGDEFGNSVAIYGTTAIIGAYNKSSATGAAYMFVHPTQQAELTDPAASDRYFGNSVAISGLTAVVGAPAGGGSGDAYVFIDSGGRWSQQAKLTASDAAAGDHFGVSVALYGSTAVVGAPDKNSQSGAAYVFTRSGTTWSQQAELTDPAAAGGDVFGDQVAIYGSTVVIGASGTNSRSGAAYVFVHSTTGWSQQAKLTASDGAPSDGFGNSVAIYGTTAVIGAYDKNSQSGAAYVFTRSGTTWSQQEEMIEQGAGAFGYSVAIYGSTVVIGAPTTNLGTNWGTGAAFVFGQSGTSWSQQAELTASDAASGDHFGDAVALSGSTAVIGADDNNSGAGAAYVFGQSGTSWSQQAELTASDSVAGEWFGNSVAISGATAIIGAPDKNSNAGAAYLFANM